jgi:hypothetical protein
VRCAWSDSPAERFESNTCHGQMRCAYVVSAHRSAPAGTACRCCGERELTARHTVRQDALLNFISFPQWQNECADEQLVVFPVPMPSPIDAWGGLLPIVSESGVTVISTGAND